MPDRNRLKVWWRSRGRRLWQPVTRYVIDHDIDEGWLIIVFAALIGAGAGYTVIGFYGFIDWLRRGAGWIGGAVDPGPADFLPFLLLPAGLWLARGIRRLIVPAPTGEMVPTLIRAAVRGGGEVPLRRSIVTMLSAGVTLGSGGSLGAEGPVAVGGATVGSALGQAFDFGPNRRRVLLACGTAAGISAAFNTPIAGVLFALEVVLGTFAVTALSPVVVASVMGAVVSRIHLGANPAFPIPGGELALASWTELAFYAFLGLACGALAALFIRVFYGTQDVVQKLLGDRWFTPLVVGTVLAGFWFIQPELLGDGRSGIEVALGGAAFGGIAAGTAGLLVLSLLKMVTSGLTMAGGGAGGVFTPSLLVGAAFGAFFGRTIVGLFPLLGISPEAYALVGMAGLTAGAMLAPLTAILIVMEMTDDYALILPLMLVCVISYLFSKRLNGESIFSEALARTGERIRHGADRSVLENIRVVDVYDRNPDVILIDAPLTEIIARLRGSRQTEFPVVTRELELAGIVTYRDISKAIGEPELVDFLIAADLMIEQFETVTPDHTLLEATRAMGLRDIDFIPVVESPDSVRLVGLLSRAAIMEAYETRLLLTRRTDRH